MVKLLPLKNYCPNCLNDLGYEPIEWCPFCNKKFRLERMKKDPVQFITTYCDMEELPHLSKQQERAIRLFEKNLITKEEFNREFLCKGENDE